MRKTSRQQRAQMGSILLVDDNSSTRNFRSIMLSTHGYQVDSASNSADAHLSWETTHPDLVLVALSHRSRGAQEFLDRIKRLSPRQRMAFLVSDSLHLSPLFYNGALIRKAEGPEDLIEQVGALMSNP